MSLRNPSSSGKHPNHLLNLISVQSNWKVFIPKCLCFLLSYEFRDNRCKWARTNGQLMPVQPLLLCWWINLLHVMSHWIHPSISDCSVHVPASYSLQKFWEILIPKFLRGFLPHEFHTSNRIRFDWKHLCLQSLPICRRSKLLHLLSFWVCIECPELMCHRSFRNLMRNG